MKQKIFIHNEKCGHFCLKISAVGKNEADSQICNRAVFYNLQVVKNTKFKPM